SREPLRGTMTRRRWHQRQAMTRTVVEGTRMARPAGWPSDGPHTVRITVAPEDLHGSAARRAGTAAAPGARARCRRRGAELDRGRAHRDQRRAIAPGGATPGRAGRDARRQLPAAGAGAV